MHILTAVYFNAPQGGLHENIFDTVKFLHSKGHQTTVICRDGQFAQKLRDEGTTVITTDFKPLSFRPVFSQVQARHRESPIHVVHVHPFASRRLGLAIAQILNLPRVATIHGQYFDALSQTIDELDMVFAVSEGIRCYLLAQTGMTQPEKLHVLPNVPDTRLFKATPASRISPSNEQVTVSLVTRLDKDKEFILDIFYALLEHASEKYPDRIHWQVVGTGTLYEEFATRVSELRGRNGVTFTGWLENEALREAYCRSDAVIAPGRCAIEAMSCGVPTIAIGSKGYVGLVGPKNWQAPVHSNFGGIGSKHDSYVLGSIEKDLDTLMESFAQRQELGRFGRQIVRNFFSAPQVHQKLLNYYRLVIQANRLHPRPTVPAEAILEWRLRGLNFELSESNNLELAVSCVPDNGLLFAWYVYREGEVIEKHPYQPQPKMRLLLPEPGSYRVRCFIRDPRNYTVSLYTPSITVKAQSE